MISSRFALPVIVLLTLVLIPTIIHSYARATYDDRLDTDSVTVTIDSYRADKTARRTAWVQETFNSQDWTERRYHGPDDREILLFMARSYDLKSLYHHPEIGILHGVDLVSHGMIMLGQSRNIPAFLHRGRTKKGAAAYVLLYDNQFVDNPVKLQLQTSFDMLFSPRKAMTLFFAYDEEVRREDLFESSVAAKILEQAVDSFRNQQQSATR